MAHITGGGIPGNLPRVLPRGMQAVIELGSWPVLPIFSYLAGLGKLEREELLRTFNLGVGMILVVPPAAPARRRRRTQAPPRKILPHRRSPLRRRPQAPRRLHRLPPALTARRWTHC